MVQLAGIGFYTQPQDESVDIDPNYDPSDFLGLPNRSFNEPQQQQQPIQQELQQQQQNDFHMQPDLQMQQDFYLQQQMQQQQQPQQQQHMEQQQNDQQQLQMQYQQLQMMDDFNSQNVGIHDDLAISDSDEENNLKMEITKEEPPENDNDDGGLWF